MYTTVYSICYGERLVRNEINIWQFVYKCIVHARIKYVNKLL